MTRAALVVEPDSGFAPHLALLAQEAGWDVTVCGSFEAARLQLARQPPAVLVTNVRLGMFNGIQLAYLAKLHNPACAAIVYAPEHDLTLARDVQQAGAFFERQSFMPFALSSYLVASLPASDRRDPTRPDRRAVFRGGRRASDIAFLHMKTPPPPDRRRPPGRNGM